jgi:hypothetical protein
MPLSVASSPETLKRFRRPTGSYQQTFRTPLDRLPVFVAALLAGNPPITSGAVTVQSVVFTPTHLAALLGQHGLPADAAAGATITATGFQEVRDVVSAALADCVDFYFLPRPNHFLLYADHDEFTTIFSARKSAISRVAAAMTTAGIAAVPGYSREL